MYLVTSCHPDVRLCRWMTPIHSGEVTRISSLSPFLFPSSLVSDLLDYSSPPMNMQGCPSSLMSYKSDVQKFNIETSDMCLYGRFPFRERILNIMLSSTLTCRREAHYLDHQNEQSGYCVDTKECSQLALSLRAKWSLLMVWSRVKSAGTGFTESNTVNFYL